MTKRTFGIAVFVLIAFTAARAAYAQSARIDTISPTMARPGDQVTITGIGFGGPNIQITVGGVPAQLVTGFGDRATFIVPDGVRIGATRVTATNPGSRTASIGFRMLLALTIDASAAMQATIGADGGSVETMRGGVTYKLTIPPGALDGDTTITLTPVVAIANLPFSGGVLVAAQFEPSGLKLHRSATLMVTLPGAVPVAGLLAFLVDDLGLGLEVDTVDAKGGTLNVPVPHFTTAGGAVGSVQDFEQQVLPLLNALPPSLPPSQVVSLSALVAAWIERFGFDVCTQTDLCKRAFDIAKQSLAQAQTQACSAAQTFIQDGEPFLAHDVLSAVAEIATKLVEISDLATQAQVPGFDVTFDLACIGDGLHQIVQLAASQALANPRAGLLGLILDIAGEAQLLGVDTVVNEALSTLASVVTTLLNRADQTCQTDPDAGENLLDLVLHAFGNTPARNDSVLNGLDSGLADRVHDARAGCRIRITPLTPQVELRETVQFSGFAVGLSTPDLFWSLDSSDTLGSTIEHTTGLFTAGQTIGGVVVKGTSIIDPARFKKATVTIVDIRVTVSPENASVAAGGTANYSAQVIGAGPLVTWSATGGSITPGPSATATYTAGNAAGTFSVTATSVDHPSQSQTVVVTVTAANPPLPILPGQYQGGSSSPVPYSFAPADIVQDCTTRGGVVLRQGTVDARITATGQITGRLPPNDFNATLTPSGPLTLTGQSGNIGVQVTVVTNALIILDLRGSQIAAAFCGQFTLAGIVVRRNYALDSVRIGLNWVGP